MCSKVKMFIFACIFLCNFLATPRYNKGKGDDTVSAVVKNFAYEVRVPKDGVKKPIPKVSDEQMAEYKANVAKYLTKKDDSKA